MGDMSSFKPLKIPDWFSQETTMSIIGEGGRVLLDASHKGLLFSTFGPNIKLKLQGLVLKNNYDENGGSAIAVISAANLAIENCTFVDNSVPAIWLVGDSQRSQSSCTRVPRQPLSITHEARSSGLDI
jgi:hypothetical protein